MYGAPYIFYFVHPIVKTVKMMDQRVNFERNLKNIRPATVMIPSWKKSKVKLDQLRLAAGKNGVY